MSFIRTLNRQKADRYDAQSLSDDDIRRVAPSAFAVEAHESRSERFAPIPTSAVITAMRAEGFEPFSAKQARCRDVGRADFTKHLIRFRRADVALAHGDVFPEVVLVNANDGTSAYRLMAGVFRIICLNGLVVAENDHGTLSVKHQGEVARKVIEGSYEVLNQSTRAIEASAEWRGVNLSRDEQHAMAEAAHHIRFADVSGAITTPIKPDQLLMPRRTEDRAPNLWTTFNRIQENAVRGGLTGRHPSEGGQRGRRVTSHEVKGIDGDVKLNRALWALGERMAALKAAA